LHITCSKIELSKVKVPTHNLVPAFCRLGMVVSKCGHQQKGSAMAFKIKVNSIEHEVDVDGDIPLLWVLRDVLGMTGTKFGCGKALCGACTVHVDGMPKRSCVMPIEYVGNSTITTIEAIGDTPIGERLQEVWLDLEVVQCGYCQSGQIMSAAALLAANPEPTDSDIDAAMAGNIGRCGTSARIREAIKQAARASVPPQGG
jgi:isoquinoline 1-oxidoreductase alpha subunit